jgi:DNA-binding MarR family transcriptional regulator
MAMEKLGYITRRQLPENKKNVYIHLTPAGRALKSKLVPLAIEVNEISVQGMKESDINATRKVLLAIIKNLAADEIESASEKRRMPSTRELGQFVTKTKRP